MSVHEPSSDLEQRIEEQEVAPPWATERSRVPEEATRIVTNYMDSSTYKEHESRDPIYTAIRPAVQGALGALVQKSLESQVVKRETFSSANGDIGSVELVDTEIHVQTVQGDRWTKVEGTLFGAGWSEGEGTLLEEMLMIDPGEAMESFEDVRKEAEWYMPPPEDE
ncbi:hypothetical protein B9479_006891 [Cryptococcus floricola]|uniref:Uncharacterized protein n=1 Tax=Cryptococcus floricola TaxID=2591691 RepID=A0A5D3ALV0_9TREE|nr:hypothetical protein B9479_006891 [Cryptococcus floricola]